MYISYVYTFSGIPRVTLLNYPIDPLKTMQEVEDYKESTILLGATTLRNTLGPVTRLLMTVYQIEIIKEFF